ncbi:primosomal protein N' [Oceanibaculum pacificum]|uniref:Replication restart protein PriA n=1 Tax=Oceanibaculum pacificum TaxID=580166 RepID=A0A154W4D9_9PROT|nr:primosomal protein N' [Oceanibaculum pacificum]
MLPLPIGEGYDYRVPEGLDLAEGDFVIVPLGRRQMLGVVWALGGSGDIAEARLKDVVGRLDAPPMSTVLRRFVSWVAAYTLAAPGQVLRMAMSVPAALEPAKPVVAYRLAEGFDIEGLRPSAARRRVLTLLRDLPPLPAGDIAREAGVSSGVVKGLAEAGALATVLLPPSLRPPVPDPALPGPDLSDDQRSAAEALSGGIGGGYSATLLDGVTGSGKTEVYFEAIAAALRDNRQVLVLLPEIALTPHWLERFEARFGCRPLEWHSELTQAQRRDGWRAVSEGKAGVVVGARSALFLPFPDLGLIVVDEEHEPAFKQEEGVTYNARDMAVVRAHLGEIPIVLVSATPSLETVANVEAGRYAKVTLPDRFAGAALPMIQAIDMRAHRPAPGRWLSPPLVEAMRGTLEAGEQAVLFLNRRGYAPLTLCGSCGHRLGCPNCTAWLVEHRLAGRLQCHQCGYTARLPSECPSCQSTDGFKAVGPGVERIAEEVLHTFPEARFAVVASDTLAGPAAVGELLRSVREREVDILIGTQLVAKGHHFPLLTLVGVIDADLGLMGGDLRAAERTYQILHQVAGRAGRAEHPGRVLLQTYDPDHKVLKALVEGDRDRFLEAEADDRRRAGMPPYGRLAGLIVSGADQRLVEAVALRLGRTAPREEGVRVLGPAPAPFSILRGRHRCRLLLKTAKAIAIQPVLRRWLAQVEVPASVRVQVDVDPYSFL